MSIKYDRHKKSDRIYLDYASTTPVDPGVIKAMSPYFGRVFGNPSSIHAEGLWAKKAIDKARIKVARAIESHADEIVFTSGGTEANNLAIKGILTGAPGIPHVVTTRIEHSSVLETLKSLEKKKRIAVTYVAPEQDGVVRAENIASAIRSETVLVSVMYANNEIGTIQPVARIGKIIKDERITRRKKGGPIYFHVDACQAPLYLNCLVNSLGADLMSFDAHKIYGPKGVGCLYIRRGVKLSPELVGGGQENGVRSTTENVPAIVGMAEALSLAVLNRESESKRLRGLRDLLRDSLLESKFAKIIEVNGSMDEKKRLANNLNISLKGIDTEFFVLKLDANGIACSTKSSCLKDAPASYVISALGLEKWRSVSSLRFTLGKYTTRQNIKRTIETILQILRQG